MRSYFYGIDDALNTFGMSKEALSSDAKMQMLAAYQARPKGLAAIPGAAGLPTPAPKPMAAPLASSGLELNRTPQQFGYGTAGLVPGAVMGAQGRVAGLPSKMAALLR